MRPADAAEDTGPVRRGWAHVRRRFFYVRKATGSPEAHKIIAMIRALYRIERRIKDNPAEYRLQIRKERSATIVDRIERTLRQLKPTVAGKSTLAGAINYTLKLFPGLSTDWSMPMAIGRTRELLHNYYEFFEDPELEGIAPFFFRENARRFIGLDAEWPST